MAKLSKKEMVSILQFIVAIICIVDIIFISTVIVFPSPIPGDMSSFFLQCMLTVTAIICIIFALSTWFYHSTISSMRLNVRIYTVLVLWTLCVLEILAALNFMFTYEEPNPELDEDEISAISIGVYLGLVVGVIMFLINVFLTIIIARKRMRHQPAEA